MDGGGRAMQEQLPRATQEQLPRTQRAQRIFCLFLCDLRVLCGEKIRMVFFSCDLLVSFGLTAIY